MALTPGTRIGAYEITARIGAGGMGEVYRARDTRLKRDVALKILPDAFAGDADRLARFQREAEVLASLNHPLIAAIYGFEESDTVKALVMELVEGETLDRRIAKGALPVDEALGIAKQIAEALEAAHEKGVIHRDLKPANIALTPDGPVKVLDFGLAKLVATDPTRGPSVSLSPTITSPALVTGVGTLLGTAAYMSPEQAKGREASKRSDVWAFGCVLYEMLTGSRAFQGEDVSETLASVLKGQPDWQALPKETPLAVRRLLGRSLEKDARRRIADIADARLEIDEGVTGTENFRDVGLPPESTNTENWMRALPWALTVAFAGALFTSLTVWRPWQTSTTGSLQRLSVEFGADVSLRQGSGTPFAISPDGSMLAFVAERDGSRQLYLRRFGQLEATALVSDDATGLSDPFFSRNGQWIGFFSVADRALQKISIAGGTAIPICDWPFNPSRGAYWGDDGYIVFNGRAQGGPLLRVSGNGGTPEPISTLGEGEAAHRWPQVLPGATAMLFTAVAAANGVDDAKIVVQRLPSGPSKVVLDGAYYGRYVRSGHLLYIQGGTLFAVQFDLERLEISGDPGAVVEGVRSLTESAASWFDVSDNGTLVYVPGTQTDNDVPQLWMDRDGGLKPLRTMPADWRNPQFAPDGRRLAFAVDERGQTDVLVYEWEDGRVQRLTLDPAQDTAPVWSPNGKTIVFASTRGDKQTLNLYWQSADGTGAAHRLTDSSTEQRPTSWHPSGRYLAYHSGGGIMILPVEETATGWEAGAPVPFASADRTSAAKARSVNGMFSPDGRWLAYQSEEAGRMDVFVRPFPGPGGPWQVSTSGGRIPTWSRRRNELFYESSDSRLMVATYTVEGAAFRANPPQQWSERIIQARPGHRWFDLHPNGDRFVVNAPQATDAAAALNRFVLINNFFDEVRRRAPTAR